MTEQIKEKPILFSGPMIRAILEGRKVQTRRIVKPQPEVYQGTQPWNKGASIMRWGERPDIHTIEEHGREILAKHSPYQVGQRLWCRETWRAESCYDHLAPRDIPHSSDLWYEADEALGMAYGKLRPSIFLPRWASRLTLEVTGVRCERVNEISEDDAEAEGIECFDPENDAPVCRLPGGDWDYSFARDAFKDLWDSINAKRGYAFDTGCWVWAVSFRRI